MKGSKTEFLNLNKIYTSTFVKTSLWAFVTGQVLTGRDINSALRSFSEYFNCDDLDLNTLRHAYYVQNTRMKECMSGISSDTKVVFKDDEIDKILVKVKNVLTDGR